MSERRARPWLIVLLLVAIAAGTLGEWTARRLASSAPDAAQATCRAGMPSPAIGAEPGASSITRHYQRHPTLGWVPGESSPHHPDTSRIPGGGGEWIALFGDGSVAGAPDLPGGPLPVRLDAALEAPVVSYAVAGHGLDRIAARFVETISSVEPSPRTALVGFRVDAIERAARSGTSDRGWLSRSRLLELVLAKLSPPSEEHAESLGDCVQEPDLLKLREHLRELRVVADEHDVELIVSLHAPAAPGSQHARELELLESELDQLAIHRLAAWDPEAKRGARARLDFSAQRLVQRLESRADYVWGTPIGFGKGEAIERYRRTGLGQPNEDSRWMLDPVAQVEISPPSSPGGIIADIEFSRAVTFEDDKRELVLRIGRVAVGRWPLWRLRKRWHDTFYIDEGIAAGRPLDFRFEVAFLRSPHELGRSDNKTQYGVAITSLTLKPEPAKQTASERGRS
jgi:hypothetical protein